ncbi:MAG TPA: YceI family protein [Pirellulales bacterium]|nr:YceI family protein [Pirellulales bacterium]
MNWISGRIAACRTALARAARLGALLTLSLLVTASTARAADHYEVDPVHSSVTFRIGHAHISLIHGRFNDYSGKFVLDKDDPSKSTFSMTIKIDTVDTNNKARDTHLQAADFFDVKQFPTMTFESTSVKAVPRGYVVSGDLTMHGVKQPLTFTLHGGDKVVEFPKGTNRVGFETEFSLKRSDFGMKTGLGDIGDQVFISIGVEAAAPQKK